MQNSIEHRVQRALLAWLRIPLEHPGTVVAALLGTSLLLLGYTATHLGVNADNKQMLAEDLPFQLQEKEFARHFHVLTDSLLLVIDGSTPEQASNAAEALAARLAEQPEHFSEVFIPGGGDFFEERGLLYQSIDDLEEFADQMARLQPMISALQQEPTLATLTNVIELALEEAPADGESIEQMVSMLDNVSQATVAVYAEYPISVSWESLFLAGSGLDPTTRRVVVAEPILRFDRFFAAAPAIDAVRASAAELGIDAERGVTLRITGYPALNNDELHGLLLDIGVAGFASFAMVLGLLWLAFRNLRLVLVSAITLVAGLCWTAAFAAAAVGELNLVSIAFAVLNIGLGVDFAIHLGMHYEELRRDGNTHEQATREAFTQVGYPLVMCTLTTAIGFLAFVPTDYRGVAELGLIAGAGMFVILLHTFTLFPALLSTRWLGIREVPARPPTPASELSIAHYIEHHARLIVAVAAVAGIACAVVATGVRFDSNVVEMRNPDTESVEAFHDLLEESATSPWYVDVVAQDLTSADAIASELQELPEVEQTITLSDFVPADQEEKLELLADVAFMLDTPGSPGGAPAADPAHQIEALRKLELALEDEALEGSGALLVRSARLLRDHLRQFFVRLGADPSPAEALATLETLLVGNLPERIDQLQRALEPEPIDRAALPEEVVERMSAPTGLARIQVFPKEDVTDDVALAAFVSAVRGQQPETTGLPVNIVEFGFATVRSLRQALLLAFVAIAGLLLVLWRRVSDALLALLPLLLAGAFTVAAMVLIDLPFNFGNVIVLPLLLGIGIDSSVHLIERSKRPLDESEGLAGTTTARAVLFSAMTTTISFSSLIFSGHRGVASLGELLVIGMLCTLVCTLIILPALITLKRT